MSLNFFKRIFYDAWKVGVPCVKVMPSVKSPDKINNFKTISFTIINKSDTNCLVDKISS